VRVDQRRFNSTGVCVNTEPTVMTARRRESKLTDVAKFGCLGAALTNENCVHGEVKSKLNSGNACCHLVQSLCLNTVLHFVWYGFETRSHM
jgi:hypothetical protein